MLIGSAPMGENVMTAGSVGAMVVRMPVESKVRVCGVAFGGVKPAGRLEPSTCQDQVSAAVFQNCSLRSCWFPSES
jgi:hypothetical protein